VQSTVDHHLYEWWITPQGQLTGIDLGLHWLNIQLIGSSHYNNNSPNDELLVRNTVDGHFYEWWIAGNQLQGVDLGAVPTGATTAGNANATAAGPGAMSATSTSLLVQSMASFGSSGAAADSTGAPLGSDPSQQPTLAATIERHPTHA
jgi:hypothetical protein